MIGAIFLYNEFFYFWNSKYILLTVLKESKGSE